MSGSVFPLLVVDNVPDPSKSAGKKSLAVTLPEVARTTLTMFMPSGHRLPRLQRLTASRETPTNSANDLSSCPASSMYSSNFMAHIYHNGTSGTSLDCAKLGEDGTMDSVHSLDVVGAPNRIRELRDLRGLTQQQLADQINTVHTTISRLETGERKLSDKWVRLIAGALGVHPGELFRRLDETETEAAAREAVEIIAHMSPEDRQHWLSLGRSLTTRTLSRKSA